MNTLSDLKRPSFHVATVFTVEHLALLNSVTCSARVILLHFKWVYLFQRLHFTQSTKSEGLRHLGALQVLLFFIETQPFVGIPHLDVCQTPRKEKLLRSIYNGRLRNFSFENLKSENGTICDWFPVIFQPNCSDEPTKPRQ